MACQHIMRIFHFYVLPFIWFIRFMAANENRKLHKWIYRMAIYIKVVWNRNSSFHSTESLLPFDIDIRKCYHVLHCSSEISQDTHERKKATKKGWEKIYNYVYDVCIAVFKPGRLVMLDIFVLSLLHIFPTLSAAHCFSQDLMQGAKCCCGFRVFL